eukprot:3768737-Alexandrium_andersonii.AAC.1
MSASLVGSEMCIRDRSSDHAEDRQEPALLDLRRSVAERLGVQTVQESPPAYEPQPKGSVENTVRQLK